MPRIPRGRWRTALWAVPLVLLAVALGVLAGAIRWRRPLVATWTAIEAARELARPPGALALADARPAAVVDLMTSEGTSLVEGRWRSTDGGVGPGARRRRWHRIQVTIPQRIAGFDPRASTVLLEVAVDGNAEAWVNGVRAPVLGQNGGSLIARHAARSRVVVTREARPGDRIELALGSVDRTPPEPDAAAFSIRSATLDFIPAARATAGVGKIVRLDPALDAIVSPGARIETIVHGFQFVEGPVWMPDGYLLFSDFRANLIYRWSPDDGLSVFRTKSGYAGFDIAAFSIPGSNGLTVDREGRLTIAEHGRRRVVRLEPNGEVTVLADTYEGRKLNSPNDLVYKSDGALYFTDPPFGLPRVHDDVRRELPYSGVFRWFNGRLSLLTADLRGPNGLAFSPDERHLYVADWDKQVIMRYEVTADGGLSNGRIFFEGGIDGMKVDERGNLYAAGHKDAAWVISPQGKALGIIKPPGGPSNLAWGDDDRRTLYVTGGTVIYRLRVDVPGAGVRPERGRRLKRASALLQDGRAATQPSPWSGSPPSR